MTVTQKALPPVSATSAGPEERAAPGDTGHRNLLGRMGRARRKSPMIRTSFVAVVSPAFLFLTAGNAFGAPPEATDPPTFGSPGESPSDPRTEHGFSLLPEHHFQWTPSDAKNVQLGVNFGLLQLALGGFNIAAEVRYRRLWLEYSHGMDLNLNNLRGFSMTQAERDQNLHLFVPYTTGFGAGFTIVDELWLGVEFKTHRYEVNAPGGPVARYQTYSVGPVLGYKLFIWKGLLVNAYARYWPNVVTSLDNDKIRLAGQTGTVIHSAHDFGFFANVSVGYALDL